MDDPWSTPWAVDTPSASPGLTPSRPKPAAATAVPPLAGGIITPTEGGGLGTAFDDSPWAVAPTNGFAADDKDDDDAWGSWAEGRNGDASPAVFKDPVDGFSAPWGYAEKEQEDAGRGGVTDSAVSFGEEGKIVPVLTVGDDARKKAITLLEDEKDAWTAPREDADGLLQVVPDATKRLLEREPDHVEEPNIDQPAPEKDIREDSESGSQTPQQKASKVQELVDMYDGIAKKAVRTPPDAVPRESRPGGSVEGSREVLPVQDPAIDEVRDGDKESKVNEEEIVIATKAAAPSTKADSVPEEAAHLNEIINEATQRAPAEAAQVRDSNGAATPPPTEPKQHPDTKSTPKHPPYPIDLSNLDALFPDSPSLTTRPEPVPDVIIDSSCTTTSERKTWYRVSRFGSSRKYDSGGDDDDYRRITWPTSEVRTKTLHIVRRWMEEDSIAGRVVLGSRKAGPLGASMFGWDSGEPQVEIGELLRQRVQHSGGGSSSHARNRSVPRVEDDAPRTPTMEAFGGWGSGSANASVPATPSAPRPPLDSPRAEMPRSPWEEDGQEERKKSADLMPPPPVPANNDVAVVESVPAKSEPETTTADKKDDDDDDWGEMVSSPAVDSSPAFASLPTPAETKPTPLRQSFDADFGGLDFFESSASKSVTRANLPPPIRTASITSQGKSAVPSPIWTPSMNSPALEPIRVSIDSTRIKSAAGTPTLASTPTLEVPRASTGSTRLSMEQPWTPAVSTPSTEYRPSMEKDWAAAPTVNNSLATESSRAQKDTTTVSASPSIASLKQPTSKKRVSIGDTCIVDEKAIVDEVLSSLPDLSYMLR